MRKLEIRKRALDFLLGLPAKQFRQVAVKVLALLADPDPPDSRPLKGHPFRRADLGEYRIVYDYDKDNVRVLVIGKRNDDEVYQALGRLSK